MVGQEGGGEGKIPVLLLSMEKAQTRSHFVPSRHQAGAGKFLILLTKDNID